MIAIGYYRLVEYIKSQVVNAQVLDNLIGFIDSIETNDEYDIAQANKYYVFRRYINFISKRTESDFNWTSLIADVNDTRFANKDVLFFYSFMYKNSLIEDEYTDFFLEKYYMIKDFRATCHISDYFFYGASPLKWLLIYNEGRVVTRFYLDTSNLVIRELLVGFLESIDKREVWGSRIRYFAFDFCKYTSGYEINNYLDVNAVFLLEIFHRFEEEPFYKNDKKHRRSALLVRFMRYTYDRSFENGYNNLFFRDTQINIDFINRTDFSSAYLSGYRVVYYDYYIYPVEDKWIISKEIDSSECSGLVDGETSSIDFSAIKNEKLKHCVKRSFCCNDQSIYAKVKAYKALLQFLKFYESNREIKSVTIREKSKYDFTPDDILDFIGHKGRIAQDTKNSFFRDIARFLYDVEEYECFRVSPIIYQYLRTKKNKRTTGNPMNKKDYLAVLGEYRKGYEEGDYSDILEWIIFELTSVTYLRTSEIRNLKRDSLIDVAGKVNQSIKKQLYSIRKTSGGRRLKLTIADYAFQLIEEAKELTHELSQMTKDREIASNIFLCNSKNSIKVIRRDLLSDGFKRKLKKCGIPEKKYTINNLRDTYMSTLINLGRKGKLDLDEVHQATGHASILTTLKHYHERSRVSYLEVFFEIIIGSVDIHGKVMTDINELEVSNDEELTEITVKDGLGFCGKKKCIKDENDEDFECLKCEQFRTIVGKLPEFLSQIKMNDEKLFTESNLDEKRRYSEKKRLLVYYVNKILQKKEEQYE